MWLTVGRTLQSDGTVCVLRGKPIWCIPGISRSLLILLKSSSQGLTHNTHCKSSGITISVSPMTCEGGGDISICYGLYVSSQKFIRWNPSPQCDGIWSWGWSLHDGFSAPVKKEQRLCFSSPFLSVMWGYNKKVIICKPGRGSLP